MGTYHMNMNELGPSVGWIELGKVRSKMLQLEMG